VVLETARELLDWVHERPADWPLERAREELAVGLEAWLATHGWRAGAAWFWETLQALLEEVEAQALPCRAALAEELGLWLGDGEPAGGKPWSGRPLDRGARLVAPRAVAARALGSAAERGGRRARELARGETIVVVGDSDVLLEALIAATEAGLGPHPVLGEGGPLRAGVRLARRLVEAGLEVTLAFDTTLAAEVAAADRVWIASESIGDTRFVAPAGSGLLLERARAVDVPVELLASSDAFTPSGEAELPEWNDECDWLLWADAPAAVQVHAAAFERLPLTRCRHLVLESGCYSARAFARGAAGPQSAPRPEPNHAASDSRTAFASARRAPDRRRTPQR